MPNSFPSVPVVLPQVSAVQNRRSSSKFVFVRTHIAIYFVSLLICNLDQAIGGIMSIPWIVAGGIYSGVTCTAQGVIKQLGNVREPLPSTEKSEYSHPSGWNSNFLFCNCRPHLQSTLSSSPVVHAHMLHRPRCIVGFGFTGGVH